MEKKVYFDKNLADNIKKLNNAKDELDELENISEAVRRRFFLSKLFKEAAEKFNISYNLTENGIVLNGSERSIDEIERLCKEYANDLDKPGKSERAFSEYIDDVANELNGINEITEEEKLRNLNEIHNKPIAAKDSLFDKINNYTKAYKEDCAADTKRQMEDAEYAKMVRREKEDREKANEELQNKRNKGILGNI